MPRQPNLGQPFLQAFGRVKLICKRCGAGPERVTLKDRADGLNLRFGPPAWRVTLIDRKPENSEAEALTRST